MSPERPSSKHVLQYTGRSFRGANGTTAWPPQAPQIAAWNSRGPSVDRARLATALHDGHRWGSLVKPLLAKKACSPAEKLNSSAQSRQVRLRSWYTLSGPPSTRTPPDGRARDRDGDGPTAGTRGQGCASARPGLEPGT